MMMTTLDDPKRSFSERFNRDTDSSSVSAFSVKRKKHYRRAKLVWKTLSHDLEPCHTVVTWVIAQVQRHNFSAKAICLKHSVFIYDVEWLHALEQNKEPSFYRGIY